MLKNRLTTLLGEKDIPFELIHHEKDFSALEAAEDTHTPGKEFAKSVVINTDDGPVLAVLPAPTMVDFKKFAEVIGQDEVALANEDTIAVLFPDCEVGAEPPFGHLYGMPVFVEQALCDEEYITFNAGAHDEAMRIRFADFERLEHPKHARFTASQ